MSRAPLNGMGISAHPQGHPHSSDGGSNFTSDLVAEARQHPRMNTAAPLAVHAAVPVRAALAAALRQMPEPGRSTLAPVAERLEGQR